MTTIPEAGSRAIHAALLAAGVDLVSLPEHYEGTLSEFPADAVIAGHHRCEGSLRMLAERGRLDVVSVIRDPKDILFSTIDLFRSGQPEELLRRAPWLARRGRWDLFNVLIDGEEGVLAPLETVCRQFVEWADVGGRIVRFEAVFAGDVEFPAPMDQTRFQSALIRAARKDRAHRPGTALPRMDFGMRWMWNQRCGHLDRYLGYPPISYTPFEAWLAGIGPEAPPNS